MLAMSAAVYRTIPAASGTLLLLRLPTCLCLSCAYQCPQLQAMDNGGLRLPLSLVQTHMPELAAITPGTTTALQVQLVLLPACADDITADSPPIRVLELRQG
jgi:hypothetical protein